MQRILLVTVAQLVLCTARLLAAEPVGDRELEDRLARLENETRQMRAEVRTMSSATTRLPEVESVEPAESLAGASQEGEIAPVQAISPVPETATSSGVTLKDLQLDMKKLAWHVGDYTVLPYGFVSVSGIYETERTAIGDYALYVYPPEREGEPGCYVDAKSTRLGLSVAGPELRMFPGAKLGGKVEIDFQGPYINANNGGVLFRQGYVEIKNDDYLLLAGQTWEILSSLYPGMLQWVPASGAGNMGYRRAMVRADRYLAFSDTFMLTVQGSLNANVISDFIGDPYVSGHPAGWPIVEMRTVATLGERTGPDALPVLIGFSGHIGEEVFHVLTPPSIHPEEVYAKTWSANLEFSYPITKQLGLQAEAFHGSNLGTFMGGALQGIDRITLDPIRATGGWVDVYYHWTETWHTHTGWCIDDPLNSDLRSGPTYSPRTYNQVIFGNVVHDVTKSLMIGLEVSQWKTNWMGLSQGDSYRFEFLTKYVF